MCDGAVSRLRWSEVLRRLELWVQVLELNDGGEFVPVEVTPAKEVRTGGVFRLRQVRLWFERGCIYVCMWVYVYVNAHIPYICVQGQSRRIQVEVRSVPDSGTMPLMAECVLSVHVGNIQVQPTSQVSECDAQTG